jgi:hypothetical protein
MSLRNKFLSFFGDLKVFKYPMFLLYDPGSYKVKGDEIRKVIETIEPGDILIRGYGNYLDGYFIPGFFSHAGLYVGTTSAKDLEQVKNPKEDKFYIGKQVAIHSMAEGVFMEDIINFCKCDYLLILRRSARTEEGIDFQKNFSQVVYPKALLNLGKEYDFKFDFSNYHSLSCTELVYSCCDEFISKYNVRIKKRRVLFTKREMIIPDDFITNEFEVVFHSRSVSEEKIEELKRGNEKEGK